MKFSITNNQFAPAMKRANGISKSTTTPQVLSDVLLSAKDGQLELHATDLNNNLSVTLDCDVEEDGHLLLEAEKLYRLTSKIDSEEKLTLTADGQWGVLQAGSLDCRIRGSDPADFPDIPEVKPNKMLAISSPKLLDMINKASYSASEDESRANLTGLHLQVLDDKIKMSSTDGYRMSIIERDAQGDDFAAEGNLRETGVIVPLKAMEQLAGAIKGHSGQTSFGVEEGRITFRIDNMVMTSLLIEGSFPDFSKIIPPFNYAHAASVDKKELAQAISIVSLFTDKASKRVTLNLREDVVDIKATDAEAGEAIESVDCTYRSDAVTAHFNFTYLQDVLGVADGDTVELLVMEGNYPTMLKGEADEDALFVIVPQR